MESEVLQNLEKEDVIDYGYFDSLVNEAKAAINERGSYDWFVSDEETEPPRAPVYDFINIPEGVNMEIPFPEEKVG